MRHIFNLFVMVVLMMLSTVFVRAQEFLSLSGRVLDESGEPLPGASVVAEGLGRRGAITNRDGAYVIKELSKGNYRITISFIGFQTKVDTVLLPKDTIYNIQLRASSYSLQEVVVTDSYGEERKKRESLNTDVVNESYLKKERGGSLMKSIERLAGVSTIAVGSGQSKPVIRGLAFNRVLVVENGVKHSGQQWGIDHGLEIDQYAVDNVEVTKGPASLQYGSDAIGGVVSVKQNHIPQENSLGVDLDFVGKTNNSLLGTSVGVYGRKKHLFFKMRGTLLDYADYKVPTDSVEIYSYKAGLSNHNLRNTAGKEQNLHLNFGWVGESFTSKIFLSNVHSKSGFFANAHGLEPRNIDVSKQDKSSRDIIFPYQEVNHFKLLNKNIWRGEKYRVETALAYQKNFREEWSKYVSHGYMPPVAPSILGFAPDLEREFDKNIYTLNLKATYTHNEKFNLTVGGNGELQKNKISGRGFIIPDFTQYTLGSFIIAKHYFSEQSIFQYGFRYDYGKLEIQKYNDWYKSPVSQNNPNSLAYLERAKAMDKDFSNISWSIGYNHNLEKLAFKANIGRSFRMPIAKELAANGVDYHRFRYEVGNTDLSPEVSYQLDFGAVYKASNFAVELTPFFNYFSNYIYLNPSSQHDRLYGNGHQMFFYTEAEVLRYGGEFHLHYTPVAPIQFGVVGEFVYSEQLSGAKKGFTLPFSPPASVILNAKYQKTKWLFFETLYISVDYKLTAKQDNIVPPEKVTKGSQVVNIACGANFYIGKQAVKMYVQVRNLFDTKYFNHTSYYRMINVPEAGRNIILTVSIPLFKKF